MAWTREPVFREPDAELRADAAAWRARIDPTALRRLVESLPGPRSRLHAPEAMAATDALILHAWREAGFRTERQAIHLENVVGGLDVDAAGGDAKRAHVYPVLDGANLIGWLAGQDREAVVIVAHHDTVKISPGADDNGAAVVATLELARLLKGRRFRKTVILAAPDFEEIGLLGAAELVPVLSASHRIGAAIVFDPIGYMDPARDRQSIPPGVDRLYPGQVGRLRARGSAGDMVVGVYRRVSEPVVTEFGRCLAATIGRERILLLRDPVDLPIVGRLAARLPAARNFSRSDHVPFWRARLPAIHVTNTGNFRNPNYHRPSDTPETLDYETLADIIAATALFIELFAGPVASAGPDSAADGATDPN